MTVPSEINRSGPYNGNGVTTVFGYDFRILSDQHLRVIKADASGNETTLTLTTHYTVSGVGDAGGGSITVFNAPADGETITNLRNMPFTQETDLENQGAYYAQTVEDALDAAAMRDQQLQEQLDRAILVPASEDAEGGELAYQLGLDITRLAQSADEIDTVASISDDVVTVAGIAGDVALLADVSPVLSGTASAVRMDEKLFTGDGVTTEWTLDRAPGVDENILVWVGGAIQDTTDYSVSGTALTIAPAVLSSVEIRTLIMTLVTANDVEMMRDEAAASASEAAASASEAAASASEAAASASEAAASASEAAAAAENVGGGFVLPELFGALHNGGDDKAAIEAACAAAVAFGGTVHFTGGRTYSFSSLVIPDGTKVRMRGAALRYLGALTGTAIALNLGADVVFDELTLRSPGTETNTDNILMGPRSRVMGILSLLADAQKGGGGITSLGQEIHIGYLRAVNYDRPIHLDNEGNVTITSGSYIGFLDIQSYVRGFRASNTDGFTIEGFRLQGRSPNASYTPGHNGFLITGCQNFSIGDGYVANAAEHAIRLTGTTRASRDATLGFLTVEKSGGCALKINPYSAVRAVNIVCAGVLGIDIGERSGGGGDNKEIVRLSHYNNIRIGSIYAEVKSEPNSGQYAMVLNDGINLHVGLITGAAANAGIRVNKDSDVDGVNYLQGPVRGVYIDNYGLNIDGFGSAITVQMDGVGFGYVYINANGVRGFSTNYVAFSGSPVIQGPVEFTGYIGGTVSPTAGNAPVNARVRVDLIWNSKSYTGQYSNIDDGYNGAQVVVSSAFVLGNAKGEQTLFNNAGLTPGNGNYGGGLEWTRLGSVRRGAAIVAKQTGANPENMGLVFCRSGGVVGSDAILEGMTLSHQGNLSIVGALSKGSGTFKIDHPIDPEKHLIHGFIEGPRYDLIYRGRAKLVNGRATVDIDASANMSEGTFAALTQSAEVMSVENRSGFARVRASDVVAGTFEILCEDEASTDEIAWMVMGERADRFIVEHDPWTDSQGRLVPEHAKFVLSE